MSLINDMGSEHKEGPYVRQVTLGRTGLTVSEIGFGGIPIQRLSEQGAIDVVRHCLDLGITFLDTAHGYTTSEARIGKAIAGRRDEVVIATKSHGLDAETFRDEMEQSFRRLQVDRIDIFQFHGVSSDENYAKVIAPGGPLDVAREAQSAGRIGHLGVTSHRLDTALKLATCGLFETLMFPFNWITREPADELLSLCEKNGVAFISMKPMGGGLLDDATLNFKWLAQYPSAYPLVGIQSFEEIDEIVGIVEAREALSDAERARIEALRAELGNRFCRACDYCQPCPQGIRISSVMRLKSSLKRFSTERFYGESTEAMVATAESCLECGDCESRCPYELEIRDTIRDNAAWYREMQRTHMAG